MKQEIILEDLQEFIKEHKVCFASQSGNGKTKRLFINMSGGFEIHRDGIVVWEGIQPFSAIEKYNEL